MTAARIGWKAWRGFSPWRSASSRRAASIRSESKGSTSASVERASARSGAEPSRSAGSGATRSKKKPAKAGNSAEGPDLLLDERRGFPDELLFPLVALLAEPGEERARVFLRGERAHVDAVQVVELVVVEDRGARADPLEGEEPDEVVAAEDLGAIVVAPAEEREVVEERGRVVAVVPELLHRDGAVPLGELLAVGPVDVAEVRVRGRLRAERLEDADLLRRVRDVVLAADDVRDPVEPVLDGRGEVVGRTPVGPDRDEVLELLARDFDVPADEILPGGRAFVGHADPDRALVFVGRPFGDEPLRLLPAPLHAVELVRDLSVPVEPEPAERLHDLLRGLGHLAARVRVLDPQAELAALVAGIEPVEERRVDSPDVQEPRRARSEADDRWHAAMVVG